MPGVIACTQGQSFSSTFWGRVGSRAWLLSTVGRVLWRSLQQLEERGQTSLHITPRVLDPGGPASGGYSHPVPTGTRMGLTTLWKISPNNSRELLLLFCYVSSAWTPGLPVTSLWLAVSGFPFSVMLPTPAR